MSVVEWMEWRQSREKLQNEKETEKERRIMRSSAAAALLLLLVPMLASGLEVREGEELLEDLPQEDDNVDQGGEEEEGTRESKQFWPMVHHTTR